MWAGIFLACRLQPTVCYHSLRIPAYWKMSLHEVFLLRLLPLSGTSAAQTCTALPTNRLTDALSISPLSDGTLSAFCYFFFLFFFLHVCAAVFSFLRCCQRGRDPSMQSQLSKKLKKRGGGEAPRRHFFGLVRQRKSNLDGWE